MSEEKHNTIKGTFQSSGTGEHVYYCHYFPKEEIGKNLIHIIFLHGAIEHQGRYLDLFNALRDKFHENLIISAIDFLGHGLSGGARAHIDDFSYYIQDFLKFLYICRDLEIPEREKTLFFGHSMGGLALLESVIEEYDNLALKPDALILSNPCIRPKMILSSSIIKNLEKRSKYLSKMRLPSTHSGFDLTKDKDKALEFEIDPLNSKFVTLKFGLEIIKHSKKMTTLSYYLKIQALFLLSTDDKIVDVETTKLFMSGVDKKLVKKKVYSDHRHDLLNEVGRKKVFKDIIQYIERINESN